MKRFSTLSSAIFAFLALLGGCQSSVKWQYPEARRDTVVDNYHGIEVADPYRWLEDPESSETLAWVEKQNVLTERFLAAAPQRERIRKRLTELWDYPRYSAPSRTDTRYFFRKNDGLQNQPVLYMQETLDSEPQVVINPNLLSDDGTIAMTRSTASRDGTLLAYGLSYHGSDWQKIKIKNIDAGEDFPETLQYCRYASIAWLHDNSAFYYNRFPTRTQFPNKTGTTTAASGSTNSARRNPKTASYTATPTTRNSASSHS
jgi:prolyl oligopeptidase